MYKGTHQGELGMLDQREDVIKESIKITLLEGDWDNRSAWKLGKG
jgi:hypothetical protein